MRDLFEFISMLAVFITLAFSFAAFLFIVGFPLISKYQGIFEEFIK